MIPEIKYESSPLLDFIESLGETEWRKCVNIQYSVREQGNGSLRISPGILRESRFVSGMRMVQ